MKTKPAALVLDFGGVISRTLFETHHQTERALGLEPSTLTWLGPFAPETDPLWLAMQRNEISERQYWEQRTQEVARLAQREWPHVSDFVQAARGADAKTVIRPEAIETIETAKNMGAKLAILSNELDLFYGADFRRQLNFLNDFTVICDATYTDILKPDPRAYLDCIEQLKIEPENCVFVDDQYRNIIGAEAVGMQAIQFNVCTPKFCFHQALQILEKLTQ